MDISRTRCCHKGDPNAGYLTIEVLMLRITSSKKIHPWRSIKNNSHLQDGYADDLSIILEVQKGCKKSQTDTILKILEEFEDISRLCVNISKTQTGPFGPLHDKDHEAINANKEDVKDTRL